MARRFEGYHEDHEIPIKKGDIVTIKKGTTIRTTMPTTVTIAGQKQGAYKVKVAGRTYKVRVDHVLNGVTIRQSASQGGRILDSSSFERAPSVRWAGTGGYWFEVDLNDIPEALASGVTTV